MERSYWSLTRVDNNNVCYGNRTRCSFSRTIPGAVPPPITALNTECEFSPATDMKTGMQVSIRDIIITFPNLRQYSHETCQSRKLNGYSMAGATEAQISAVNAHFYRLSSNEFAFFSAQTGITEEEALKTHIISVAAKAFDVSGVVSSSYSH